MSKRTNPLTEELYEYVLSVSSRETDVLARVREETWKHSHVRMLSSPEVGQFMHLLVRLIGAKKTIELGVFTGYSTLWTALGLPEDGRIIACDINEEYTKLARGYWKEAGVDHKIDLRLGPATETLNGLIAAGEAGTFDFMFIDADKPNHGVYYDLAYQLVRQGGLIAIDNALWNGKVIDPTATDTSTTAIRDLNKRVHTDDRVDLSLLPIGDGVTLLRKR
jgi:caffeoyl-CoA O-methyltransferase